ncbi:hypothetical protein [Polaromonas sp.]|uniref:hypothetical protein n=1 Tax=Polaromonas sp. TaxID=1869339 RepID=UPI0025EB43EF|nr:hypothetical protein [Polaromonas sp.]
MQPIEYHLYRAKFIKSAQGRLFDSNMSARSLFSGSLQERPSLELRRNYVWHIGNIESINASGGKFAVGRTSKTTIEKFDPISGNFADQLDDSGPYTFVFYDLQVGLLGIGKRTKVAPNVQSIARKIQKLLED